MSTEKFGMRMKAGKTRYAATMLHAAADPTGRGGDVPDPYKSVQIRKPLFSRITDRFGG